MNILTGIQNVLEYINDNWTAIVIILSLIVAIIRKIKDFLNKSEEDKIEIAKKQIKEIVLKLVTDAEADYWSWIKAGSVKRSQVINQIFEMYPILSKAINQEEIIAWIDYMIDDALEIMREVLAKQVDEKEEIYDEVEDMSAIEEQ